MAAQQRCWSAPPPPPRDALEGKGYQRRPQEQLGRRLEEVAKAVGGGYCRLQMPLKLALGVGGTVARHRLGALEEGGGGPRPPSNASLSPAPPKETCAIARVHKRHKRQSAQSAGRKLGRWWDKRPEVAFCHKVKNKRMPWTGHQQVNGSPAAVSKHPHLPPCMSTAIPTNWRVAPVTEASPLQHTLSPPPPPRLSKQRLCSSSTRRWVHQFSHLGFWRCTFQLVLLCAMCAV